MIEKSAARRRNTRRRRNVHKRNWKVHERWPDWWLSGLLHRPEHGERPAYPRAHLPAHPHRLRHPRARPLHQASCTHELRGVGRSPLHGHGQAVARSSCQDGQGGCRRHLEQQAEALRVRDPVPDPRSIRLHSVRQRVRSGGRQGTRSRSAEHQHVQAPVHGCVRYNGSCDLPDRESHG